MAEDEMVDVDVDDIFEATGIWVKHHYYDSIKLAHGGFVQYMGEPYLPAVIGVVGICKLTPEQHHRMRLLLGPHAHTVIKAYHAKKSSG